MQRKKIHYWANHLSRKYPNTINSIFNALMENFGFCQKSMSNANKNISLENYTENYTDCVESLLIDGLKDRSLFNKLSNEAGMILYTGGGIVPESLLSIPQIKFLHIHPGYLPNIRGADCALWSYLLTGHFSASCFYLAEGIDVGDVLLALWLPKLKLHINSKNIDLKEQYRMMYAFIDPWIRSFVLREFLQSHDDLSALSQKKQMELLSILCMIK